MTSLLQTTPIMSNNNTTIYRRVREEKKSLKKKQRNARPERTVKPALPASPPENSNIERPKKKMRTKENLFNHVDDDTNALLDAQEAKRSEDCENQEYMDQVYSKISVISWVKDHEYVKFQVNNEALNALDESNVKVYEKLSCPEADNRMTLTEYEAYLSKEESYWNLWKSHGLSRKQYEDHQTYEQNCETLMNLTTDDPEYEVLRIKIQAFEDEMDARVKEEEAKMNEWFLNFNNSVFMQRLLK
jgi:hypothetical protein